MEYHLSNENKETFSSIVKVVSEHFNDEQKEKFEAVIQKIDETIEVAGGYALELDESQSDAMIDFLIFSNDNYENIKSSARFQELVKIFSTTEKGK